MHTRYLTRSVLIIWVFLFILFSVRPYFKSAVYKEYADALKSPSLESKQASVTGREIYDFIKLCGKSVPPNSTYDITGLGDDSLTYRRVVYYLYPNTPSSQPDYLFVYKVNGLRKSGYKEYMNFGQGKYILQKER